MTFSKPSTPYGFIKLKQLKAELNKELIDADTTIDLITELAKYKPFITVK